MSAVQHTKATTGTAAEIALRQGIACSGMARAGVAGRASLRLAHAVLATEFVHATAGVDDLLLVRIERMTGRADLDEEVFAERRTRRELVAATAGDFDVRVVGVDIGFHGLNTLQRPSKMAA